jgi:hypothetical protein
MKTILVAIAKNEGPYLAEWAFYHKIICEFDQVHIYNNDSSDESKEKLEILSKKSICSWEDWPRDSYRNPPQQTAYANAMHKFKNKFDWICFMDLDEFLVFNCHENIKDCISKFDEKTGSISFNWKIFYSLDQRKTEEPIIKRVNYYIDNPHVKTIARTKAISGFGFGIHTFPLLPGYKYMHSSGLAYNLDEKTQDSLDIRICTKKECYIYNTEKSQINHYQMKSEEEISQRDKRGKATVIEYTPKHTINNYNNIKKNTSHKSDNNIKEFIEKKYGLEKFYEEIKKLSQ